MLLCEHCGHQLITLSELSRFKTGVFDAELPWRKYTITERYKPHLDTTQARRTVTFDLLDVEQQIKFEAGKHICLGRADEDSDWQPTLDLTPYGAIEKGVSRMHADIFLDKDHVFLLELGCANGTWVNGVRLYMGRASSRS